MHENTELMAKVAKGYLTQKLLPAVALATGLGGCATDTPTVRAVPTVNIKFTETLDEMFASAPSKLSEVVDEVKKLEFKDAKDLKGQRHNYFSKIRAMIDDPIQIKFERLSSAEKNKHRAQKIKIDRLIATTEQKIGSIFDEAHLKFKPWQRERFDNRR